LSVAPVEFSVDGFLDIKISKIMEFSKSNVAFSGFLKSYEEFLKIVGWFPGTR